MRTFIKLSLAVVLLVSIIMLGDLTTLPDSNQDSSSSLDKNGWGDVSLWSLLPFAQKKEPAPQDSNDSHTTTRDRLAKIKRKIINAFTETDSGELLFSERSGAYLIEYYPYADMFFVFLTEPLEQRRDAAEKWFLDFDLSRADLCILNVRFYPKDQRMYDTNPNFGALPQGCPYPDAQ